MGGDFLWLVGCLLLVLTVFLLIGSKKKYKTNQGLKGEKIVSRALNFWLKSSKRTYVYNDIMLKTRHGSTQIDHIVLSRKGVFVIETKFLNGQLIGDVESKYWTHINGMKQKNQIYNPIFQNNGHIKHICNVLKLERNKIKGIVVNVGDAKLIGNINPMFSKPKIKTGLSFIFSIMMMSNSFGQAEINKFKEMLDEVKLDNSEENRNKHIKYVERFKKKKKGNNWHYVIFVILLLVVFYYIYF